MYVLYYDERCGWEPSESLFKVVAVSNDRSKLEKKKQELLDESTEFIQKFEKWNAKRESILKEYFVAQRHAIELPSWKGHEDITSLKNYFGDLNACDEELKVYSWIKTHATCDGIYKNFIPIGLLCKNGLNLDKATQPFPEIEDPPTIEMQCHRGDLYIKEVEEL